MGGHEMISLAVALVGMGCVSYSSWLLFSARQTRSWTTASGWIAVSQMEEDLRDTGGASTETSRPIIEFQYNFPAGDQEFTGNTVRLGQDLNTTPEAKAIRILERYPAGSEVTVYYDRSNPADCCLERGSENAGLAVAVGVIILVISRLI